jgi:DNA-binding response OmpR family regulator
MRMESDASGVEVIAAARAASYHPAVALLTAFPTADEDWAEMGADKMLVKPMHTRVLLQQIEKLLTGHEAKLAIWSQPAPTKAKKAAAKKAAGKKTAKKVAQKKGKK